MLADHSNIALILSHAAERHGDRAAFTEGPAVTGFAALAARAGGIKSALAANGVRPGDRVAIFLDRGSDASAALFGAYAAGAIAIVINERYRARQVEYVLGHSSATVLLTSSDMLDRQHRDLQTSTRVLRLSELPASGTLEPVRRISPDLAQIIYTSGSTGLPKGVVYSHGALNAGVRAVAGYLGIEPDDRVASLLSFSAVYGLNQMLTAFAVGAGLAVELSPVPHQMVVSLAAHGVTVLAAVPPLWIQLLGVPEFQSGALRCLRIAQNAGGHLPPEIVKRVRAALPGTRLFLQYGMTETYRGTYLPPEELDRHPDSMGRAMPDTEILILDEHEQSVPVGAVGELVHRGPTIATGYWNDPEGTARVFRPNPLRPAGAPDTERVVFSGDMVRRDAEGFLYYVSRRDRMIKTMGYRVGPDEIADALHASGEIHETVIDAEPDAARGTRIIAYVVLRDTGSTERLARFCRAELPAYSQPAEYIVREQIPRLPSGKYDLDTLRQREGQPKQPLAQ